MVVWPLRMQRKDLTQRSSDCRICTYKRTCTIDNVEAIRILRKIRVGRASTMGSNTSWPSVFHLFLVPRSNWVCVRHSLICTFKRFLLCKPKTSTSCITTVGKEWLRATAIVHPPCVCYQSSSYGKPKASW